MQSVKVAALAFLSFWANALTVFSHASGQAILLPALFPVDLPQWVFPVTAPVSAKPVPRSIPSVDQ